MRLLGVPDTCVIDPNSTMPQCGSGIVNESCELICDAQEKRYVYTASNLAQPGRQAFAELEGYFKDWRS